MVVYYSSLDPVNLHRAQALGAKVGFDVIEHWPRDGALPPGTARVVDVDHWVSTSPEQRERLCHELVEHAQSAPVAVHGYSLTKSERQFCRWHGILFSRRGAQRFWQRYALGWLAGQP